MNFFILLNTKEDILKNGGKQIVAIDFDKAFFSILSSSMATVNCLVTDILQIVFFVLNRRKKLQI